MNANDVECREVWKRYRREEAEYEGREEEYDSGDAEEPCHLVSFGLAVVYEA
jgi:hypothetical protein